MFFPPGLKSPSRPPSAKRAEPAESHPLLYPQKRLYLVMMDNISERPLLFDLWPQISYINCPECKAHWHTPRILSEGVSFPPAKITTDNTRVYCPHCGILLPELAALLEIEEADVSPVANKPFLGTITKIQQFLDDSKGAEAKLWEYQVSHSQLVLLVRSPQNSTHAFFICRGVVSLELPSIHWSSDFTLQPTDDHKHWQLCDKAASARIVCSAIGIFHQLTRLW